jgi:hypothetical protein
MSTAEGSAEERYNLITRGLGEVLGGPIIKAVLDEGRTPKAYWGALRRSTYRRMETNLAVVGTAPTGRRVYTQ